METHICAPKGMLVEHVRGLLRLAMRSGDGLTEGY